MLAQRAKEFAIDAHNSIGQIRKYTGEPYSNHIIAVADIVATVTTDEEIIKAAFCHDILEDTPCTVQDLQENLGCRVTSIVKELTNITKKIDGSRAYRKAIEREHIKCASPEAKTIKIYLK